MNILDKIAAVLGRTDTYRGYLPDKPDNAVALFDYDAVPPVHTFGGTDFIQSVQARVRGVKSAAAYSVAESISAALNRYADSEISVIQTTPILDIGYDNFSPQRQEYTINFQVRRK